MSPGRGAVLFDIDGTLVDTNYPHVLAWQEAFATAGGRFVSAAELHQAIGLGSDRFISHVIGHDDDAIRRAHSNFYSPNLERLRPFPGAADLLREVAGRGGSVVLATSASREEADRLTEAIGAGDAVQAVLCKDDVDASKPAPDVVEAALERAGVQPARAVFVGDTVWDVEAAARVGLDCVGVCSGGIGAAQLREAGAVEVYRDVAQLLAEFDGSRLAAVVGSRDGAAR